eukprot:CAMPEP_0115335758 /NCGR_PEP_ID=MMETSP0270-20121206/88638_1 /TAXON_ID=71861 /ORGANISM="Scrippsiella trochoidea, Strain CCMP3099" /LENGTH=125 /DNA_ID=CAMNT_0002756875 /DNA_START=56 /DNA_END=433 /DNA_ORIENTATION=-
MTIDRGRWRQADARQRESELAERWSPQPRNCYRRPRRSLRQEDLDRLFQEVDDILAWDRAQDTGQGGRASAQGSHGPLEDDAAELRAQRCMQALWRPPRSRAIESDADLASRPTVVLAGAVRWDR